jgi:tetratricopeptide (TPR) repeat protein
VDSLSRAASIFTSIGDVSREADARQALGNALMANGRIEEAREQFEWVAASSEWEARWCGQVSLAAVDEHLGEYRKAMDRCDDASSILEEAEGSPEAADGALYVNANRVNLYLACGDYANAVPLAEKCLADAEASGNSDQHLEARLNLGVCYLHQGRWALGHRTLAAAISLARFVGDRSREAMSRATLAIMLAAQGDYESSTLHAKDALAAGLSQGDHRTELFAQMALADAYLRMDRIREARYHANQALAVATTLRLPLYQAESRIRMARVSLHAGELSEALENAEKSLAISESLGARHLEALARVLRGSWNLREGNRAESELDARAAADIARDIGSPPIEWEAQWLKARVNCAYDPPHDAEAESAISRAVELIEAVRADLQAGDLADTVLEDRERQEIYLLRAELLVHRGELKEAQSFVQQAGWPPLTRKFRVS